MPSVNRRLAEQEPPNGSYLRRNTTAKSELRSMSRTGPNRQQLGRVAAGGDRGFGGGDLGFGADAVQDTAREVD